MHRRTLLAAIGLSSATSTAGCLDAVLDDGHVRLARFSATNHTPDPVQFELRVDRDGETVHESSHRIRGTGERRIYGEVVDCDWGTTPGEYAVFARVEGAEWSSKSLETVEDGWRDTVECATALAEFYEDGPWLRVRDDCDRYLPSAAPGVCSIERATDE